MYDKLMGISGLFQVLNKSNTKQCLYITVLALHWVTVLIYNSTCIALGIISIALRFARFEILSLRDFCLSYTYHVITELGNIVLSLL